MLKPLFFALTTINLFAVIIAAELPKDIKWETNDNDPVFSSPSAIKGGTFRTNLLSFPLTLRNVGPDSNGSFRSSINDNQMSPTYTHPNTGNVIPGLAQYWAYGKDNKTVYYKLYPNAQWSDGKPVTADDFIFTLEFMRSKHIVAPWYNTYYTEQFEKVIKYDDQTFAIVGKNKRPNVDLHYYYGFTPYPKHAITLDKNFTKAYNWKIIPNTGPYVIDKVRKGKHITFKRNKKWWAKDLKYFKNRFNVDRVKFSVIRNVDVSFEHFKKGKIETFGLTLPDYWYQKSKGGVFETGAVEKLWFYNDAPRPSLGIWLNMKNPLFQDKNVRLAFLHAFNIEKVINTVLRNDYERLQTNVTGYGDYTNNKIKARQYDLKKVEEYAAKAGWDKRGPDGIRVKNGQRLSAKVTYGNPTHEKRLVILREEAKKAGIDLVLNLMDSATSFKFMLEKKHEIAYMGWGAMHRPQFWGQYHSANADKTQTNNFSNTKDKKLDDLIDAYRKEFNNKKKAQLSRDIQQRIFDLAVMTPTFMVPYFRSAYWGHWKLPKHFATKMSDGAFDPFHPETGGLFWLDKKDKERTERLRKERGKGKEIIHKIETFRK
jgi:microcin C transport system substrate-binding protein